MASDKYPSVTSALCYRDPMRMYRWLEDAFGFEPTLLIVDGDGKLAHSEMAFGNGRIMVGTEWSGDHVSPVSVGGKNTQTVHLHLADGIQAHYEHARAAGAEIMQELAEQFYGDLTYRARDPEGHIWTFGQTVKAMTPSEWDAASGLTTTLVRAPK
jgi:uncharacterized glyoxalase superfamily protein PhnB